jgi:hypothetical protein
MALLLADELAWIGRQVRAWRDVDLLRLVHEAVLPEWAAVETAREQGWLDPDRLRQAWTAYRTAPAAEQCQPLGDWLCGQKLLTRPQLEQARVESRGRLAELAATSDRDTLRQRIEPAVWQAAVRQCAARNLALPEALAPWLEQLPAALAAQFPEAARRADPDRFAAVVRAAAACGALGPDVAGVPPAVLDGVLAEWDAGPPLTVLAERVMVFGALLPSGPADWQHAWRRAGAALGELVRREVLAPLSWLRRNALGEGQDDPRGWVAGEAVAVAALLRGQLVHGCECWRRWADFGIESPVRGLYTCVVRHALAAWDRREPLREFVWRAVVQGDLGARPRINAFRKGMLARAVTPPVVSGVVLRCQAPASGATCKALVGRADRCEHPEAHFGRVREPDWWLWRKGAFVQARCRRCRACGYLYFQSDGACPLPDCPGRGTGEPAWSRDFTFVWLPAREDPFAVLATHDAPPSEEPGPWEQAVAKLHAWPAGLERQLGLLLVRDRESLDMAARKLQLAPGSSQFRRLLNKVALRLGQELGQNPADLRTGVARALDGLERSAAARPEEPLRPVRDQIQTWPRGEARRLAEGLFDAGQSQADLARERDCHPADLAFRRLLLEVVLRLAVQPRLQKLTEVQAALAAWPDDLRKAHACRLFGFPAPPADNGKPAGPAPEEFARLSEEERSRHVLRELAVVLGDRAAGAGADDAEEEP